MITCGPTGSTGQQIANAINANTDGIAVLNSLPISRVYCTSALASKLLTTTPAKIALGNTTQTVHSGIVVTAFSDFKVPSTGVYEIHFSLSSTFDNNAIIAFNFAVNGTVNTVDRVLASGTGRPIDVTWSSLMSLNSGDVFSIYASTTATTVNMVIESSSIIVKKLA
jgi:hypothetical protein